MNMQQLYYFQAIAEYENYTLAAKELNVAQSGLCRSIAALEEELSAQLFYRVGRNIKLTPCGVRFLEYVNRIITELENGKNAMREMQNPNCGVIRLAFVDTLSTHFIPNLVKEFYLDADNNNIKFEFYQKPTMHMIDSVKNGDADLGFGAYENDPQLSCYLVLDEELLVAVSKEHPLAAKDSIELKELANENIIAYNNNGRTRCFIDSLFEQEGINPKIVSEVDSNTMMASIVSTNLGVSLMARMYGTSMYDVKLLQVENTKLSRPLYMFWASEERMLPVVRKFRDFVMSQVVLSDGAD